MKQVKHAERCAMFAKNLNTLLEEKGIAQCSDKTLANQFNKFMADYFPEEMIVISGVLIGRWRKGSSLPCIEYFFFLAEWLDCKSTDLLKAIFWRF